MKDDISAQAIPAYAKIAEALAGKTFPNNYVYGIGASSGTTNSINGDTTYSGQVGGFSAKSEGGTFTTLDAEKGIVSFGGVTYQIMGPTSDGLNLVLGITKTEYFGGTSFTTTSPAILISNGGTAPAGNLNYNTNNTYTTPSPVCFAVGTLIRTPDGDVSIEKLTVGDPVITSTGVAKVCWTGSMRLRCAGTPWEQAIAPIRIAADAIEPGVPARDLVVSPGHGIGFHILGDVLIPAGALVNDLTITRELPEWIEYWHVELEEHTLVIAEGLSTESYLDVGNRLQFEVAHLVKADVTLDPGSSEGSYPRLSSGAVVDAVRERLHTRARHMGWALTQASKAPKLVVDSHPLEGVDHSGAIRFVLSAQSKSIVLSSETFVPGTLDPQSRDMRPLGIKIVSVEITDGFETRSFGADHCGFSDGFHQVEQEGCPARWTNGSGVIPSTMLEGLHGDVFLTIRTIDRVRQKMRKQEASDQLLAA